MVALDLLFAKHVYKLHKYTFFSISIKKYFTHSILFDKNSYYHSDHHTQLSTFVGC